MASTITHYELLGLDEKAGPEEIRAAWRRVAALVHPDAGGSDVMFVAVSDAYSVLGNPAKRRAYDDELARARAPRGPQVTGAPRPSSSQSGPARPSSAGAKKPSGSRASNTPASQSSRSVQEQRDDELARATSLHAFIGVHAAVAIELVLLAWLAVWLTSKGIVTAFEAKDAAGHVIDPLRVPPLVGAATVGWWMIALVVAVVVRPVVSALDYVEHACAAVLMGMICLSGPGLARGQGLAWMVALVGLVGVMALWLRATFRSRRARGVALVSTAPLSRAAARVSSWHRQRGSGPR